MKLSSGTRNLLILAALAAVVDFAPGGGNASSTLLEFIYLTFFGAFAWGASRLYRERRQSIYLLGDRRRAIAYVAVGVIALTLTGTTKLWHSGAGANLLWLALLLGAGYTLFAVIRSSRTY